jgi:hypothetical protein
VEPPPEPKAEPAPEPPGDPRPAAEPKPIETPAPTFGGAAFGPVPDDPGPDDGSRWSMLLKVGVPVLVLGGAIGYFMIGPGPNSSKPGRNPENQNVAMGEQGWVNEWASDAVGSRRARQLTFYRPSIQRSDYIFEFTGTIESKALGWVFRAQDTKNYYGMKLEIGKPGQLLISRFAVVDGRESSSSSKPLPIVARPDTAFTVRVDVSGPRFSVYLQGQPVDVWTDNRLKTGAVGFMNEREERARTSSVRVQVAGPAN